MGRQAIKTLHITEKTWDLLWNLFAIKCTNEEAIASMIHFFESIGYGKNDFSALILEYRQSLIEKEKELIIAQ